MTVLQALFLGIIQGATEFLPISSSAHLVIVPCLLNWHIPSQEAFVFDVLVQLGTLLAVIAYFWKDLYTIITGWSQALWQRRPFSSPQARLGWYLLLATLPAAVFGLLLKDHVEAAFSSSKATSYFLFVTSGLLVVAERLGKRKRTIEELTWKDSLWIGFSQVLALFPGISRSGATITGGMTRNLDRPAAARFSFLMAIPIMLSAGVVATYDLLQLSNLTAVLPQLLLGFVTAAVVGYFSIRWLLSFLTNRPLYVFSFYCILIASLTLLSHLR
ncbi:MAG: undecaprenyl-diphosphatase UppP [Chloroflexota bacterium]